MIENNKKTRMEMTHKSILLVIPTLFFILFLTSFISADSITFDNIKSFQKTADSYGIATIRNVYGLGSDLMKIELKKNTDFCMKNCSAEGTAEIYQEASLFNNAYFKDLKTGKEKSISYKIYLQDGTIKGEVLTPSCSEVTAYDKINKTNYVKRECKQTTITTQIPNWEEYEGEKLKIGKYNWKIEGQKGVYDSIDWIGEFDGVKVTEWATWNSSFNSALIGYWGFDEGSGTNAREYINGTYNGTMTGTSCWTVYGKNGTGVGGNGCTINISQLNTHFNPSYTDSFSGSFWGNSPDWVGEKLIIGKSTSGGHTGGWSIWYTTGKVEFYFCPTYSSNCYQGITGAGTLTAGTNNSIIWSYNGTANTGMTIWINGVRKEITPLLQTLSSTFATDASLTFGTPGYLLTNTYIDEVAIWNRTLSDSEATDLYNGGSGIFLNHIFGSYFNIELTSPVNNTLSSLSSQDFLINYTYNNFNITNATYYIWYSNNSIFNKTTIPILSSLNSSNLSVKNFTVGSYKWNVYSCGTDLTDTVCYWGNKGNYTIEFAGSVLNEFYNNVTFETASEYFTTNFSLFPGSNVISAYLIYNGTPYIVSDITKYNNSVELKRTIDISLNNNPYGNETKFFYWSFILSNGGTTQQNSTLRNQTIVPINIVYCNSTFTRLGLNFTTYDETNPNPLINATFHTTWNFWLGSGTIKKNYSFEDTTSKNSSFKFCINPVYSTIHSNLDSEITSPGFFPRTYYLSNASINNITQEVKLRMINDTLGVKFFHTIRRGVERVSGAIVIISKFDIGLGIWVVVGIRKSDYTGQFIEYLELDKDYTYSISQNGVFLGNIEKTSTCSASPCMVNLDLDRTSYNMWNGYYDTFAPNVVYNISYNKTSHNVTYTFVDTSGLATYFRLQVNKVSANETGSLICDKTIYATVGSLVCDLTGQTGQFVARGYVARSPEKIVVILYGVLSAIAEVIGKNDGLFFTLLMVIILGLIGAFNPAVGILLAGLAFIFAGIMGFIMISITAMILVFILMIILIIKMGRSGV